MKRETFDVNGPQADAVLAALPETMREIALLVGMDGAMKLVRQFGGTSLRIPQGKHRLGQQRYAQLAQLLGEHEMSRLAEHFRGSDAVYIPRCSSIARALRDIAIRHAFDEYTREESSNRAVAKLARMNGLCERQIWKILKG
ncbi:DNA transposition protein [Chitiniphilus purpureus]|uniref:DNA transposition protein n=1 Tax=Chitiniphilus purpureus TaxID=2981137 RepID=A0ABY6DJA8_9NEIS|nr:Mor transcription activator family protein [Chitiniphilus sp. CD1]UXY14440.1 DNA transposition protein [Chitiniphilus sp. CD1]